MKKHIFKIITIILGLIFTSQTFSQNDQKLVKRDYYNDSIVSIEKWYNKNKELDSVKTYFKTKELYESFHYKNNYLNGKSYQFNKKGDIITTWNFKNNTLIERTDHIIKFNKKNKDNIKNAYESIKRVNELIKANPKNTELRYRRARIRYYLENRYLALIDFKQLTKNMFDYAKKNDTVPPKKLIGEIYNLTGSLYASLEKKNQAIYYKLQATLANPESTKLAYNFASHLYTIKSYKLSENLLKTASEKWPNHSFTNRLLASLYIDFEDYKKALHHINIAFEREEDLLKNSKGVTGKDIRTLRGFIYHKLGDTKKGITDLKKAINLNTSNAYVYRNLGIVYYDTEKYEKACECLKKAQKLGYEKTYNRDDIQDYLDYSCKEKSNRENIEKPIKTSEINTLPYLHPNPSHNVINIKNLPFENFQYTIYDYKERVVMKKKTSIHSSINISYLPKGFYTIKVISGEESENFILIKDK
ncbi:T9SS type A sorting domain-containing protein [Thalassobellus citreus]|uniref:T9SS type A sorting domain-containing protein n=1 Tax=Thalassobellus citreus TaxID=3367752 RepID=UPI00379DE54A